MLLLRRLPRFPPPIMSANGSSGHAASNDPFLSHLVATLSVYELGPGSTPIPRYDGPSNWQTETIIRSLSAMARRMYSAEEALKLSKVDSAWESNAGHSKKRRSIELDDRSDSDNSSGTPGENGVKLVYNRVPSASTLTDATTASSISSSDALRLRSSPDSTTTVDFEMCDADTVALVEHVHFQSRRRPGAAREGTHAGRTDKKKVSRPNATSMRISLDGLKKAVEPHKMFERALPEGASSRSAPATSITEHAVCPHCARPFADGFPLGTGGIFGTNGSPGGSPMVVPPGPLATAAFESGLSAVEELKLLKTQVQDVSRVCQAVARGDLSQKITVPVQGVVMIQLKDVINTMARVFLLAVLCICAHVCTGG